SSTDSKRSAAADSAATSPGAERNRRSAGDRARMPGGRIATPGRQLRRRRVKSRRSPRALTTKSSSPPASVDNELDLGWGRADEMTSTDDTVERAGTLS